jgi:hypothetical protein
VIGFLVTYLIEQVVTVTYSVSIVDTYISRSLDGARIGGCRLPFDCSWRT